MSTCFPVLLANLCFTMAVERKDHMEVVKHLKKEQELKDAGREENCLRLQHASVCPRALQHGQVHPDYEHLPEALLSLSQGQDLALRGKHQLQAKLENLEQVLKHMREAAERRQQLELEHEQALAVLNAKQQEIELLQKAQVEAKKEHEGAVQLLENTLDSMQMDNDQNSNTSKQRYSGKVHLCIARYSYNPFDGPNENPEAELPLTAGKYLYVYGDMDEDGFYEGELLDGQRGLVPSNFVDFVQDNEARLSSVEDQNVLNRAGAALEGELELSPPGQPEPGSVLSNGAGTLDLNIDEIGEDIVPYPRKITLIKQLAKSVIVGWEPPLVPPGWGTVSSYNVLVDKEVRMNIALGSRTKALIEKLNTSTCTYRISIQSITSKGSSDELQCTLLVGKDVIVAPSNLRVDNITQISAELSWLPTNSNYSHVIFLNEEEFDIVKAASYKYHFFNLKPNMAYKVKVMAKPHQMPWQLPLEQREKKEAFVEFSTLPAGPPAPPQEVSVRAGSAPGTLQVCWKPPALSATGTSHGASVTGYGVYAKGQRVAEVALPAAEGTALELARLRALDARELSVRTLSAQGESLDSAPAAIPPDLLVPPSPHPRTAPKSKPLASAGAPETKEEHFGPHFRRDESWEQTRSLSPVHGHMLEPPTFHGHLQGRRSPSPNRILPQPQGAPVPNTVAKAMAREAAQRVAESHRMERRSVFSERSSAAPYSDEEEEEDGYDSPRVKRRGASVDEFLKESELGKQAHYCLGDEYHTESSRGSDLSDILEEDEEELYSEMQLEEGGRRRLSLGSHGALKEYNKNKTTEATFVEQPGFPQQTRHSKRLFSIPEVAEEDGEYPEVLYKQGLGMPYRKNPRIARGPRARRPCCHQEQQPRARAVPGLQELEERGGKGSQGLSRSPDSGLDCGSEEEEPRHSARAQWGSDEEQPWLGGRHRRGSDEEESRHSFRHRSGSEEEQSWFGGRPQRSSDEERSQRSFRPQWGSEEEEPRHAVRPQWGSEEEEPRHAVRAQWGSEEEEPRHAVRAQWGSDEERSWRGVRAQRGSDEERPRPSFRPQWSGDEERSRFTARAQRGSEEEESRPSFRPQRGSEEEPLGFAARAQRGSEEEESQPSFRPQWSSDEERSQPSFRHRGGSEEEEPRPSFRPQRGSDEEQSRLAARAALEPQPCPCRRGPRPLLARRRTLTRQSSIEEDLGELGELGEPGEELPGARRGRRAQRGWKSPPRAAEPGAGLAQPSLRDAQDSLLLGNPASAGRPDRVEQAGRRSSHGSAVAHRSRPLLVPSIDGYGGHDRLSPDIYEESETDPGTEDLSTRIFVALFDYDPLTMSPNPDAAEEELPFKEGQIIKVYGDKDADGFYRGETCARVGLIPCNMVSEIQADDEEMMDQLLKQGFLPLNTPIEKIERGGRRGGRQQPLTTRRMVALYDYDPRESSPNVDVEAELTFCTGDIITVFGEIDEDGFYYGELNGQKGLVPSNFLEEVPDDVEVFLSEAPSRYAHDTPTRAKAKRVPPENTGTSRRAPSPTVHLHSGSPPSPVMGSGSPGRGRDMASKKKKGLLSKGKKLLKKLGAVK
ncbi:RIMS-binding protein 2 [Serinus canaria]|uniref:RIMS-binding protein 2 n=1 Tax=Serinus canaria TaxID=9135 RepID=UPI0021CC67CB|nr:RIMS-binding protein 2 [Serinus canaria]